MLKILLIPPAEVGVCFWCEGKKKFTVHTEFSNGFLRGKPLCFECLERAVRVQVANETVRPESSSAQSVSDGKSRKESVD